MCEEDKEDLEQNRNWGGGREDHKLGGRVSWFGGTRSGENPAFFPHGGRAANQVIFRPSRTGVICNGGLAAASRVRVGGPPAIVIGYVCGSRVEFETMGGELPAVAYWHLLALIGDLLELSEARVTCQSLPPLD